MKTPSVAHTCRCTWWFSAEPKKTDAEVDQDLADAAKRALVADEIADVVMFAMLLADRLGIDLAEAITTKLAANERNYPVELARGNARKYTDLRDG